MQIWITSMAKNFKAARAAARAPFEAFNQLKGLNPSDCYQ